MDFYKKDWKDVKEIRIQHLWEQLEKVNEENETLKKQVEHWIGAYNEKQKEVDDLIKYCEGLEDKFKTE